MRIFIAVAALLLLLAPSAFAQGHSHGDKKGPHGGAIQDIVGIEAELVVADRTLTVHVYEESGKPVPSTGYSGSVLVGTGQARQVVQLTPGPENTLTGAAGAAIARGTQVTLQLKSPAGKSGQAKF